MTRFLVVPQWQGSPAARAMLLGDGAAALAGDLPCAATEVLDVPLEAGESLGTAVLRKSSLLRTRALVADAIATHSDEYTIVIGGDCGVTVAAMAARDDDHDDVAVLWLDAHPDLHRTETSASGAFAGMALRAVMGEGDPELRLSPGIHAERVVLAGARAVDAGEQTALASLALTHLTVSDLDNPDSLADAAAATSAARVYVHVDVDVIDPSELSGVFDPVPFGVPAATLCAALTRLRARMPLAGATIAGFAPRSPLDAVDDLGVLLRLVGALA